MQVLLLDAGKIASGAAEFLAASGDREVTVADGEAANPGKAAADSRHQDAAT